MSRTAKMLSQGIAKKGLLYQGSWFGPPSRKYCRSRAYILAYHSVHAADNPYVDYIGPTLAISAEDFDRQMAFLVKHYRVVSLTQLVRFLSEGYDGDATLIALTFDDGYQDNFQCAFPILRKYGLSATFYLTVDCIGGKALLWPMVLAYCLLNSTRSKLIFEPLGEVFDLSQPEGKARARDHLKAYLLRLPRDERETELERIRVLTGAPSVERLGAAMLNWDEVHAMHRGGMEFGSHTLSHPSLPYIPEDEARHEIAASKRILEEVLQEAVVHFCYPHPGRQKNFNPTLSGMLKDAGYLTSVTSRNGFVTARGGLFEMNRKKIYRGRRDLAEFYYCIEYEALQEQFKKYRMSHRRGGASGKRPCDD